MKTIFESTRLVVAMLLATVPTTAQDQPSKEISGFIRLANAVAQGTGKVMLKVDGKSVHPDGYNIGDVTGGIPLKPGTHNITISREGVEEGTTKVNVALNDTTILIPFAEKVPASDIKPAYWAMRILRLKQQEPETGRSGTFVSVSQNSELRLEVREPDGKWNPVFVKRLDVAQTPILYPRGYVPVKFQNRALEPIPVSDEGNYVVLLYDDAEGKLQSVNFRDVKFLSAD